MQPSQVTYFKTRVDNLCNEVTNLLSDHYPLPERIRSLKLFSFPPERQLQVDVSTESAFTNRPARAAELPPKLGPLLASLNRTTAEIRTALKKYGKFHKAAYQTKVRQYERASTARRRKIKEGMVKLDAWRLRMTDLLNLEATEDRAFLNMLWAPEGLLRSILPKAPAARGKKSTK